MPERDQRCVTFVDESRGTKSTVLVSSQLTVRSILFQLPRHGFPILLVPDRAVLYALWHVEGNRDLGLYETLQAAGVEEGHTLEILSVFDAETRRRERAPVLVDNEALCIVESEGWFPLGRSALIVVPGIETRVAPRKPRTLSPVRQ